MGEAHFELAQMASFGASHDSLVSSRTQPTNLLLGDGCVALRGSQVIRLPNELGGESFPDLKGKQLELLKYLCLVANASEDFFLLYRKNQWLRTAITYAKNPKALFSLETLEQESKPLISENRVTIQCNLVPYSPYWRKLLEKEFQTFRDGSPHCSMSKRVFFPCDFIDKAIVDNTTLMNKLHESCDHGGPCAVESHFHEGDDSDGSDLPATSSPERYMLKIDSPEVQVRMLGQGSEGTVFRVLLGRGIFAKKVFKGNIIFRTELDILKRISHPNIVYSFGIQETIEGSELISSLYMEVLENNLGYLIIDRMRIDGSQPPFSHWDSVHILLQIAQAMAYLHSQTIIHGDLKPLNILVSHIEVLGEVQEYLVKVADFGSAQLWKHDVKPKDGSTIWAAPEVLLARRNGPIQPNFDPYKTDVYSFGITAFEVLTGLAPYLKVIGLREDVLANKRPDLKTNCLHYTFWEKHRLVALIERCWNEKASIRPSFPEICRTLEDLLQKITETPTIQVGSYLPQLLHTIDRVCELEGGSVHTHIKEQLV